MRFGITIFLLMLPLMSLTGSQDQERDDPYSLSIVRFELKMRSGQSRITHSFSQKHLARLGDGVSVALIKILDEQEMINPTTVSAFLPMIRDAFSQPALISPEVNRKPQVTLMLLSYIRERIKDLNLGAEVESTANFVREHTT
jgi:hypothetical protein